MTTGYIEAIGIFFTRFAESVGRFFLFFVSGVNQIFSTPFQTGKILDHIWFIGAKSVFVILLTGLFTGMVLGLQGYYTLVTFGSEAALGTAVSLTLIRELGPVLGAIMVTARAGSAMAAEIGVMRMSEQIDALFTMQIEPVRFVFTPRLLAAVLSFPLLTALFDMVGIFGGYLSGSLFLGINEAVYMDRVINSVKLIDIWGGFFKSLVFAVVVTTICCYRGYYCHVNRQGAYGAKAVSLATTSAVVQSCVCVLICDYVITSFLV
ncbi:MAG: ABC transporter permease [Desulfotignum sp.]|jgi:phospholipid/cholesterol/gamma-HCH transport system permease protein|nr:ABC transporter permease [Desulfotignum sp.]